MTSLLFTEDAQAALDYAMLDARQRHSPYIDIENLLLGLLNTRSQEPLQGLLANVSTERVTAPLIDSIGMIRDEPLDNVKGVTKELQSLLVDAAQQAQAMGQGFVNGGHLLLAMMNVGRDAVRQTLTLMGLQADRVQTYVAEHSPKPTQPARTIQLESPVERRQRAQQQARSQQNFSRDVYILLGVAAITVGLFVFRRDLFISFWLVVLGWIVSLSVHEFSHALVAYWGGDYTVKEKGYLTMNPLRYTHPFLSIGLPLIFLAMGGIGLPGGAVYIERHRLRSKWWGSAVSAAGPFGTGVMAIIFSFPFWSGIVDIRTVMEANAPGHETELRIYAALAILVFLQVMALFFNLLPIPPLDGFGIVEPLLPDDIVRSARSLGLMSLFLIFFMFRFQGFSEPFFDAVESVMRQLSVPEGGAVIIGNYIYSLVNAGFEWFLFWQ